MRVVSAPTSLDVNVITRDGFDRLQRELDELTGDGRQEAAAWLRATRLDCSDAAENAELRDALEAHERLERRIAVIETRLAGARVAGPAGRDGVAGVGSRVRLRGRRSGVVEFTLVGAGEADIDRERISVASPMGRALVGRRAGETIDVATPRRRMRFQVVSVTPEIGVDVRNGRRAA